MSRVGERYERIGLYSPTIIDDGQGGKTVGDPTLVQNVWCKILKPKFWTVTAQSSPAAAITQGFTIRKRKDITYDWTVKYNGDDYKILHIDDSEKTETILMCQVVIQHA